MGDYFKPLMPGDPVTKMSRTAYNQMLQMLKWWKTVGGGRGLPSSMIDRDQSIFLCRNDSGEDIDEYGVVGIDGPLITPADNEREFLSKTPLSGVLPTVADHLGKWGVFLGAIPDGQIGKVCVSGIVPVRVYVSDPADKYCDVIEEATVGDETVRIGTGGSGQQLIWLDPDAEAEEIAWGLVRLGPSVTGPKFRNFSDEEIPPYAVMQIAYHLEIESGEIVPWVVKPDPGSSLGQYLVNGPTAVQPYVEVTEEDPGDPGIGTYQDGLTLKIAYDTGTPSIGQVWGPKKDQWTLTQGCPAGALSVRGTSFGANWGIIVDSVYDETNKILAGRQLIPNLPRFHTSAGVNPPRYAVMAVTGTGAQPFDPWIAKPSDTPAATYIVNEATTIVDATTGTFGVYQPWAIVRVACDITEVYPALGELWGPKSGSWSLWRGADGADGKGTTLNARWGVVIIGSTGHDDGTDRICWGRIVNYGVSRRCTAVLTGALAGDDASIDVDGIVPIDGGWAPVTLATDTVDAYNVRHCAGADDADCLIEYNETNGRWEIVSVENVEQVVVTAVQISGTLQRKTRTLWGNWEGAESGWT